MLPRTRPRSDKADRAAAFGTLVHHWKETGEEEPQWADDRDLLCLQKKLAMSGVRREVWWPTGVHEVSFAIDLERAEVTRYTGDKFLRDEWKAKFDPTKYLTGTIDLLDTTGDAPWVDDLKTGHWPVNPKTSRQLRSYALVPWLEAGSPYSWVCVVTITQWEKYPLAGQPKRKQHIITGFDMLEHLEEVRWAVAHPNEVTPSEQCRFCDSRPSCPTMGRLTEEEAARLYGDTYG